MSKLLWSCVFAGLIIAGGAYLWLHTTDEKPEAGADSGQFGKNLLTYFNKQLEPVRWPEEKKDDEGQPAGDPLAPIPISGGDLGDGFDLPPEVIANVEEGSIPVIEFPIEQSPSEADVPMIPTIPPQVVPANRPPRVMPLCEHEDKRTMPTASKQEKPDDFDPFSPIPLPIPLHPFDLIPQSGGAEEQEPATHEEDHSRSYCPYTGRYYPKPKPKPEPAGKVKHKQSREDEAPLGYEVKELRFDDVRRVHRNLQKKQEVMPDRDDVDTMECRPSDLPCRDLFEDL